MIQKTLQSNIENPFEASRQMFHNTKASKYSYGVFVGLSVLLVILKLLSGRGFSDPECGLIPAWAFVLILLSYPLVFTPILQYLQVRKVVKSSPSAHKRQNHEISGTGVRNYRDGFKLELGWEGIPEVRVSKDYLLMSNSKNCAFYLPKRNNQRSRV